MVQFRGHRDVETFSGLLEDESPRCAVIVSAAYFDETLERLLKDTTERSFFQRIDAGLQWGLLTRDEHADLNTLRQLRNEFAHDLRRKDFDEASSEKVDALRLWNTASNALPLQTVINTTLQQLLYVVGVIAFRLQHRDKPQAKNGPLPEPPIADTDAWPPVTDR